jgi:hypothetical protein
MKKLNKMQYEALASEIYNKVALNINKYNNSLSSEEKVEVWKKNNSRFLDRYSKFLEEVKYFKSDKRLDNKYRFEQIEVSIEEIVEMNFKATLEKKEYPSKQSIYNELILETIEETDIQSLIDKLIEKFSK